MTASARLVDRAHPAGEPAHRCVLLSPAGQPGQQRPDQQAPTALLRGLRARAVEVVMAADAPAVMAILAERPCDILIVHGRVESEEIRQLLDAVRRFYPRLALWQYAVTGSTDGPELRRLVETAAVYSPPPFSVSDSVPQAMQPNHTTVTPVHDGDIQDSEEPLISGEELRMLLGEDEQQEYDDREDPPSSSLMPGDTT